MRISNSTSVVGALILVSSFILFYQLGSVHLSHWDEAWYAAVSRTMAEYGQIATPLWNTQPFFEKPPLYYWFSAVAYRVFSDGAFAARFFSALSGVVTIVAVYFFTTRQMRSRIAGLIAALVLTSTIGYIFRARTGNLDTFHTLWIVLSFIFTYYTFRYRLMRFAVWAGVFTALAFLSKGYSGLIILAIPAITILIHRTRQAAKLSTVIVSSAIVLILFWIVWFYLVNGERFIQEFFFHQSDKFLGRGSILSHFSLDIVRFLYHGMKWWILALVGSTILLVKQKRTDSAVMIGYYCLIYAFIFSFIESKNNWLIIPLYPFCAMLIGMALYRYKYAALGCALVFAGVLLTLYRTEYMVQDVTEQDAQIARLAAENTSDDEIVYTTDSYFPALVYYSQRKVLAVFSDQDYVENWWIRPRSEWDDILSQDSVTIISTTQEYEHMKERFDRHDIKIIGSVGDKILLQKHHEEI